MPHVLSFDNGWDALLDPGDATDFFAFDGGRPALDPRRVEWDVGTAWWCSEISRTVYRNDDRTGFFGAVGLETRFAFAVEQTAGALVATDRVAVLVFRGTAHIRNWLTNLRAAPRTWDRGRVHDGFRKAFDKVWPDLEAELARLEVLALVTGHSLGGALATLAAARFGFVAGYTFGSPRVGDAEFAASLRCPLHRVVNDDDVVPRTPPRRFGYVHAGTLQEIGDDPRGDEDAGDDVVDLADRRRWFDPHASLADHAPVNYSAHLQRLLSRTGE